MEAIYDPRSFRSSEHFNTSEYFQKFRKKCPFPNTDDPENKKTNISLDMGLPEGEYDFETLEASCSIDLLQLIDEPLNPIKKVPQQMSARTKLDVSYPVSAAARQLNVVRCKEIVEGRANMQVICNKRFLKSTVLSNEADNSKLNDMLPGSNFIYSIYVYRPYAIAYGQRNSAEKMRFAMEIEALGSNTLAEVADIIQCVSNMGLFKEVENTKVDFESISDAKKHYPSQTIFIDGVFYNDFRSEQAIDYSKVVIDWAKDNNIGKFTTDEMDKVKLESLTPRLGYPYVFIHHGNCEHIFTFADARLIQPSDVLVSKRYPRIYSFTRVVSPLCFLCDTAHSKWVVKDCERFPQEKVFLCTECCDSYLYLDGNKIGTFKLYPYYDTTNDAS